MEVAQRARALIALLVLSTVCSNTHAALAGEQETLAAEQEPALRAQDPLAAARAFSATQPDYLQAKDSGGVPAGLPDLRASTCGECHQQIYAEWQISTHARAYGDDPQFQAELAKSRGGDGDVRWMCLNCHTPLLAQQEKLVTGLTGGGLDRPIYAANPGFDGTLQHEAITCASCHVRDAVVLGPFGGSGAPHPVRKSRALLGNGVCTNCHQAKAHFEELALACVFDTGAEFEAGPYAAEGYTCQKCHMPEIERPLVAGGAPRLTRRHWFGGSMIAKQPRFEAELAAIRSHYPDGLSLSWSELPDNLLAHTDSTLKFRLENSAAGHLLPTGDPERFLLVTARVRDATGAVLAERTERIGAVWQWSPQPHKLSDNRLAPREVRVLDLQLAATEPGTLRLELEASKWRINDENLRYHDLVDKTVPGRVFFRSETSLEVR
jgi:hypothetical protein